MAANGSAKGGCGGRKSDRSLPLSCLSGKRPQYVDAPRILELLGSHPSVVAWFNGHNHEGNYGLLGNTHFVNFKGMVDTPDQNTFAIADVFADRIVIRGFGREENRLYGCESGIGGWLLCQPLIHNCRSFSPSSLKKLPVVSQLSTRSERKLQIACRNSHRATIFTVSE